MLIVPRRWCVSSVQHPSLANHVPPPPRGGPSRTGAARLVATGVYSPVIVGPPLAWTAAVITWSRRAGIGAVRGSATSSHTKAVSAPWMIPPFSGASGSPSLVSWVVSRAPESDSSVRLVRASRTRTFVTFSEAGVVPVSTSS